MEHYAGIDVSLELSSVCVVDAQGKIVKEAKLSPKVVKRRSIRRETISSRLEISPIQRRTKQTNPLRVLFFEILPKDWNSPTIIVPKS